MSALPPRRAARRLAIALFAFALLLVGLAPAASATSNGHGHGGWSGWPNHNGNSSSAQVLLGGLSSPKGIDTFLGQPVVAQGAFGPPGPVLYHVSIFGRSKTFEVSEPLSLVDIAVGRDGSAWLLGADLMLYRKTVWGEPQLVANIPAYQQSDPDPEDQDGDPGESNPYGLAVLPNGDALVADAANNDLLRVTKNGDITTVARFGLQVVSTDHIPGFPEPAIPAESVPTSIAVGPHGVYVGELKGFPFRPGSSNIYLVNPNAEGATCDGDAPNSECSVVHGGLTSIQDIAYDPWRDKKYVYELAADGAGAFEAGFDTGVFPPAVLLELEHGQQRELVPGQLSQPGGVTIGWFGGLFVTDGMFSEGRLLQIKS